MMLASILKKLGSKAVTEWRTVAGMDPMYPSYDQPMKEAKRELQNIDR